MLRKYSFTKLLILCSLLFSTFALNTPVVEAETTTNPPKIFATHGQYPALPPDGKTVIVGKGRPNIENDNEYLLGMYDVETGSLLKEIYSYYGSEYYKYSPTGKFLYSAGTYTTLIDGQTGEQLQDFPYEYPQVTFKSSNENIVAFTYLSSGGTWSSLHGDALAIRNASTNEVIFEKKYDTPKVMRVALHPFEPVVAITYGLNVYVINYDTGKTLYTITNPFKLTNESRIFAVNGVYYSPNGDKLTVLSSDRTVTKPLKQYDVSNQYKETASNIDVFIGDEGDEEVVPADRISYSPSASQLLLHFPSKVKMFDTVTGKLKRIIGDDHNYVVFSNDMKKIAYTRNAFYASGENPTYIEVQDFPIKENTLTRIDFRDPFIQLRTGHSTYYGLDYIDEHSQRTLLEPNLVMLEPLDANIIEISPTNKIIAKKPGSTMIKATYKGLVDYINVEVKEKSKTKILIDTLYDSSMVITGFAPPRVTLYANLGGREYRLVTKDDGSFIFNLDKPLKANTRFWFMYLIEEVDPHAASYMSDYVHEMVLRDTVAPKPPSITTVNEQTNVVEGKTEPNALITITPESTSTMARASVRFAKASSYKSVSIRADKKGYFKIKITSVKVSGKTLKTTSKDLAGNKSKATITKVKDKTPPSIIKINKVYNYSTRITGKTEAYATVTVKKGSSVIAKGKAQKNGDFSLKVNKQKSGTALTITVSDSAKNTSKAKKITVYKGR